MNAPNSEKCERDDAYRVLSRETDDGPEKVEAIGLSHEDAVKPVGRLRAEKDIDSEAWAWLTAEPNAPNVRSDTPGLLCRLGLHCWIGRWDRRGRDIRSVQLCDRCGVEA